MKTPRLSLATKLKVARQDAGLSQKDMGEALRLSDKAISSYEVGRAVPSIDTLKDISKVTHKPMSYFFDERDPEDFDLQIKIKTIEKELLEIKKILSHHSKRS